MVMDVTIPDLVLEYKRHSTRIDHCSALLHNNWPFLSARRSVRKQGRKNDPRSWGARRNTKGTNRSCPSTSSSRYPRVLGRFLPARSLLNLAPIIARGSSTRRRCFTGVASISDGTSNTPTVCLDVISFAASSYGMIVVQSGQLVAHELALPLATHGGHTERTKHLHQQHAPP